VSTGTHNPHSRFSSSISLAHSQTTTLSLDLLNLHFNPHYFDERLTRQIISRIPNCRLQLIQIVLSITTQDLAATTSTTLIFKTPRHTKGSHTHHDYHNANTNNNITTRYPHAHGTLLRCISLYPRVPFHNLRHCVEECVYRPRSTSLLSQEFAGAEEDIGSL